EDDQGALGVLVAEAATYPTGEVVGEGAAGDGDGAVAGVADSAADVVCGDGRVVADQGPRDGQVGALEHVAHLDGVEPDAGALIHGGVTSDHRASVDEDLARAIGLNAAAGVTGAVVANRGVVESQGPGGAVRVLHGDAATVSRGRVVGDDHV